MFCLLLFSCGTRQNIYYGPDDLAGGKIAVMKGSIDDDDLARRFHDAEFKSFSKPVDFIMAVTSGRFDAGVADIRSSEEFVSIARNVGYLEYEGMGEDSVRVLAHKSRLPGRNISAPDDIIDSSIERLRDNIIANDYWKFLVRGLSVTLTIFICALILTFIMSILLVWMSYDRILKWIADPLMWFIKIMHDVPSIVLIFFFYYVIFASLPVNAVFVCVVALAVYCTGAFTKIMKANLEQVDVRQHQAAAMLGLHGWKKYRLVILPQAVKRMIPFLAAESKVLLRATTYAGYISLLDLVKVTEIIRNQTYDAFVPLLIVSLVFLLISWLVTVLYDKLYVLLFGNA